MHRNPSLLLTDGKCFILEHGDLGHIVISFTLVVYNLWCCANYSKYWAVLGR